MEDTTNIRADRLRVRPFCFEGEHDKDLYCRNKKCDIRGNCGFYRKPTKKKQKKGGSKLAVLRC